jgi:hypothetical protein
MKINGEKIHENKSQKKYSRITSGGRECRWIDKPFVVSTLKSFQSGHPAGRNTMVESNKWKKWNMEDVEENTIDIILASAKRPSIL